MKKLVLIFTILIFQFSFAQKGVRTVTANQFADSPGDYFNKTIKLVDVFYSDAGNLGSYSDVRQMTLRSKGDNFEDIYGLTNYSNKDSKYYCRTIECSGNKVKLLIPKTLSQKMPNTTSSDVVVTGKVIRYDTIEVISIVRRQ